MGTPLPLIFGPCLLWSNGWVDEAGTWHEGRPQPRHLCVRWRTSSPSPTRWRSPQIFGPCLLWPNGWMDQDATWYGGRPWPTRHCVRRGTSYPQKKGHTHSHPIFGLCLLWPNGWIDEDAAWYGSRPRLRPHCTRRGPSSRERGTAPPLFGPCLLWPRSPISATAELLLRWATVATIDIGGREWRLLCSFRRELGPRLIQCGLGRGLLPSQVASSSIQPFCHNRHGPKIGWEWVCPFLGLAGSPSNTKSHRTRPTSIPSGILIHPAIWPQ